MTKLSKITIETAVGEQIDFSKLPRMVRRALEALAGMSDSTLCTTKRLSEKLNVTHGALLMHSSHPALRKHRVDRGQHTYWGNAKVVSRILKADAKEANT